MEEGSNMERVKEFLLTDIRLLNGYLLVFAIVMFLVLVGSFSYMLSNRTPRPNPDIVISIK
jgi:hypothetical protein